METVLVGTVAYWLDFFLRGTVHVVEEEWYLRFERSFPVADGWMSACSLVAAVGLFDDSSYGTVFGLVAAGALVFLALLDLTFNVQNKLYRLLPQSAQMWAEVVIITWCLTLGGVLLGYLAVRATTLVCRSGVIRNLRAPCLPGCSPRSARR